MKWNSHWNLEGKHAFLGASKYQWIKYDPEKLITTYQNFKAVERGTKLHGIAKELIEEGIEQKANHKTFNTYVNDAIKFKMSPEVVLYYSDNAFGTTDAINYDPKKRFLRIHDLKTGVTPAHMEQLMIYAAFFCLEYHIDIYSIDLELRIYQNDEIVVCNPDTDPELKDWIQEIMNRTIENDKILREYKETA